MADIRVHIDTLEYTREGLKTKEPISLQVGAHNKVVLVRPERVSPVAVNAGTFGHDSCFPTPGVLSVCMIAAAQNTVNLLLGLKPSSIFQIFGHAEPSGDEAYNKTLSEKRAEAFRACLLADAGALQTMADSEGWGLVEDQVMLRTLKCDPGPIDGVAGVLTSAATFLFQHEYVAGVFHRHLTDRVPEQEIEPSGELDGATRRALIEAYVLTTSAHLAPEQLHPSHPAVGCSEYNLRDPEVPASNRRVSLVVHPALPAHHDAAPCQEGDISACPIDGRDDRSTCLWYREHVRELAPRDYAHRHFDLRWLELDNGAWLLSALTTLPDGTDVSFQPFRTAPLSTENEIDDERLETALDEPLEGVVRSGVAQVVWAPAAGPEVAYPQMQFAEGADPRTAAPLAALATFRCSGGGVQVLSPPPGRELVRLPNDADTTESGSLGFLAVDSFGRVYQHGASEQQRPDGDLHPLRPNEPRIVAKRPLQMKLRREE